MSEETLTLPRSGIVLRQYRLPHERMGDDWIADVSDVRIRLYLSAVRDDRWWAQVGEVTPRTEHSTEEAAIAALDSRVLALRAALLPPGALAKALRSTGLRIDDGTTDEGYRYVADAVLAALGAP